jgi:hypothetical protein
VTLVAVWLNEEAQPSIWVAADSRITGELGVLLDEGGKLFTLPVICRKPGDDGFFSVPYFTQQVGVACVGGALMYQQVYTCAIPILSNLIGMEGNYPGLEDIATAVARITTRYVSSLGEKGYAKAHRVTLVFVGYCAAHGQLEAYELGPVFEEQMFVRFESQPLSLDPNDPQFFGDKVDAAREALALERERVKDENPILWHRAPTRIVRQFIEDDQYPTIGGDVQLGYILGSDFIRATTVAPKVHGEPAAMMRLNNIDLDEIGQIGPCVIGLTGMLGL